MKKHIITILLVVILATMLLPAMAFAHGHGRMSRNVAATKNTVCPVADCNITETHTHGHVSYAGHRYDDGHAHHQVCPVQGCTAATLHKHGGVACFPHSAADGHGYHRSRGHHD